VSTLRQLPYAGLRCVLPEPLLLVYEYKEVLFKLLGPPEVVTHGAGS
jgi:hypothetical protein